MILPAYVVASLGCAETRKGGFRSSYKEHAVDALAQEGDEGRGKLR